MLRATQSGVFHETMGVSNLTWPKRVRVCMRFMVKFCACLCAHRSLIRVANNVCIPMAYNVSMRTAYACKTQVIEEF